MGFPEEYRGGTENRVRCCRTDKCLFKNQPQLLNYDGGTHSTVPAWENLNLFSGYFYTYITIKQNGIYHMSVAKLDLFWVGSFLAPPKTCLRLPYRFVILFYFFCIILVALNTALYIGYTPPPSPAIARTPSPPLAIARPCLSILDTPLRGLSSTKSLNLESPLPYVSRMSSVLQHSTLWSMDGARLPGIQAFHLSLPFQKPHMGPGGFKRNKAVIHEFCVGIHR